MKLFIKKIHLSRHLIWNSLLISCLIILFVFIVNFATSVSTASNFMVSEIISLPQPDYYSNVSVEQALLINNQNESFNNEAVSLKSIAQLLWASKDRSPDKNKLFFSRDNSHLQIYVVAGNVGQLASGVYLYDAFKHELIKTSDGDKREKLCGTISLLEPCFYNSAAAIIFTAEYSPSFIKYTKKEKSCVHFKAGRIIQNIEIQSISLDLTTAIVDTFSEKRIQNILNISHDKQLLYIMPIGKKAHKT